MEGPRAAPHRHARPRRLRLRGLAQPRRLRGRRPARRRQPGHRGPDARQLLRRPRGRPHHRRGAEQDRPAPGRAGPAGRGDRADPRAAGRRAAANLSEDRGRGPRAARRRRGADPGPNRRPGRAAARPALRLALRPLPGGGELGAGLRRDAHHRRPAPVPAGRRRPRRRGGRCPPARAEPGRRARARRGRLPHRRRQGHRRGPGGRDRDRRDPPRRPPPRLPRTQTDGVLRAVPGGRRRVRRPARRAREAAPQRFVVHLRARDVRGARLRVPVRVPRPPAHGDRPRAPRTRVRPVARRHRAERRVPGAPHRRHHRTRRQSLGDATREPGRHGRGAVRHA